MSRQDRVEKLLEEKRKRFPISGMRTHANCERQTQQRDPKTGKRIPGTGVHRPGKTWMDRQLRMVGKE